MKSLAVLREEQKAEVEHRRASAVRLVDRRLQPHKEIWSRVVDEKVRAFPLASFFGGCKDTDPFEIVDCRPATEILFPAFLLRGEFLCVAEVISGRGLLKFTVDEPSALHHQLDLLVPREPPPGFFRFESKLEDHRQGRHS